MTGKRVVLKYRMSRSQIRGHQAVNLNTGTLESLTKSEPEIKREPLAKLVLEVKHESTSDDERALKQGIDRGQSVLGKRPRTTSFPPIFIEEEEEEEEETDDESYTVGRIVKTEKVDFTDDRTVDSPNPKLQSSNEEIPEATQNPKLANKNHQSRYTATRKRYKQELKALPDPKHLTDHARATDYEVCKELAIFLSEEFEHEDRTRLETGRKLRKANATLKDFKKEVASLKAQIREARADTLDLKRKLRDSQTTDTDELQQSLRESQVKLEQADILHKRDLADVQLELKEHKSKQKHALLMVGREKQRSEDLAVQLKASIQAQEATTKDLTDLKQLLTKEKERRNYDQNTIDELRTTNRSYRDEIQTLKAEIVKTTEEIATSESGNQLEKAALKKKCQDLETGIETFKKKYDEQKQRVDKILGDFHDLQSQA